MKIALFIALLAALLCSCAGTRVTGLSIESAFGKGVRFVFSFGDVPTSSHGTIDARLPD